LGNPSDGYFGKTISIIVRNFGAHVSLYESPELHIEPQDTDINVFRNIYHLVETVQLNGYYGGSRLIKATIKKFFEYCQTNQIKLPIKNFTIRYNSSIPRQVGLAGSSAIVTATMRALMTFYQVKISNEELPTLILSAEVDELGINAGLQDRVIQTYEGCVYMDFDKTYFEAHNHGKYERLDPLRLPNLYIAYKTNLSKVSGKVLNPIRAKYEQGDAKVIKTLERIAAIAEEGRNAVLSGDTDRIHDLMNENFDCRSKIVTISESNKELVRRARTCGTCAKFTGSGGSIIGIYQDDTMLKKLVVELNQINARVIRPFIV
jgi:glucuronokinase